jgi:hypothetical protein
MMSRMRRIRSRDSSDATPAAGRRDLQWIGPAILVVAFVALLAWSWGKWPDVMVDFGRELYVPWQLAAGKSLYRDIAYFNGPLSPWLNALFFRAFGVGLLTLVIANLAILVAIGTMIYILLRELSGPLCATVGGLVFLTSFAFAQYMPWGNYNFVTPYSHEMTHGTALSLAALVFLSLHLKRGTSWSLLACGVAVGFTFLTKAEFFIAVILAVLAGLGLVLHQRRAAFYDVFRAAALLAAGILLPPLVAFLFLLSSLSPGNALGGVLGSWRYLFVDELASLKFYREILGIEDLSGNLCLIGAWSLRYLAFLVPATLIGLALRRPRARSFTVAAVLAVLAATVVIIGWRSPDWGDIALPLPVALLAGIGFLFVFVNRAAGPEERLRRVLSLSFVLYAFALLLKMLFNVRIYHYGFALAMPATIAVVLGMIEGIPRLIERRGGYGTAFRAASLGLLIALIALHVYSTETWFRQRTTEIGRGTDRFLTDDRGRVVNRILARVEQLRRPGETLAVFPEGVMLNYLSRMPNPTPYINFMPPEVIMFGEQAIVNAFRNDPPDWIIVTDRAATEYGFRLLGLDYGQEILAWVERRYALVEKFEDDSQTNRLFSRAYILRPTGEASAPSPIPSH